MLSDIVYRTLGSQYGESALSQRLVYEYIGKFGEGRASVSNDGV